MSSNRDVHGGDIRSNAQGQNLREQISQLRERMAYLGRRCDRAQASKKKRDLVEVDLPPRRRRARRGKLRALPRHQGLAVRGEVLAGHGRRSAAAADLPAVRRGPGQRRTRRAPGRWCAPSLGDEIGNHTVAGWQTTIGSLRRRRAAGTPHLLTAAVRGRHPLRPITCAASGRSSRGGGRRVRPATARRACRPPGPGRPRRPRRPSAGRRPEPPDAVGLGAVLTQ